MVKWIAVMKFQPNICLDDREAIKNPRQVGWRRDLNSGPPKFEPSLLPMRHLTW